MAGRHTHTHTSARRDCGMAGSPHQPSPRGMPPPSTRSDPPLSAPATRATPRARAGKATSPPPPPIPLTRSPVAIRCYQIIIKKTPSARSKMEEWAAARLLRICRAYVPALRARKANPEVAFLSLALHAKRRALAYNERKEGSVDFCLIRRIPHTLARIETLVVTRSGRVQFIDGGVTSQLDTVEAISTFLAHHPRALDRLKHVAKYPWGQNYTPGKNFWPYFTDLGVDSTPLELFDDGVVKPAMPKVLLLKA